MLDTTDPHLLKGKARIQEIGKILALGILRMQVRKQNQIKLTASLSPKRDSSARMQKNLKYSLDFKSLQSEDASII